MFDMFTAYWLIGVAHYIVEMIKGGAACLNNMLKEVTQLLPSGSISYLAISLTILCLGFGSIMAILGPLKYWIDYRNDDLLR